VSTPALPPCATCWEPVDPTQPHIVLLQQTEQHDPPGEIHVRHTQILTARHEVCS
jgi:hypothetical protein